MPPGNPAGYAKAFEVNRAPGDEAGRIRKMMTTRPTLNANQRRSKVRGTQQDLSGASPDGTLVGRGGRTQQLGRAAMARMPQPQAMPSAPLLQTPPMVQPGTMGDGPPPGSVTPDMAQGGGPMSSRDPAGWSKDANGVPIDPNRVDAMARGVPPPQFADKLGMMAQPMGGQDPAGGRGFIPPGAAGMGSVTMERMLAPAAPGGAGMETAAMGGKGQFAQGLPPQIMQRLQALRGGGMSGGAIGMGGMGSSFADFWARQQQGNGGMAY